MNALASGRGGHGRGLMSASARIAGSPIVTVPDPVPVPVPVPVSVPVPALPVFAPSSQNYQNYSCHYWPSLYATDDDGSESGAD